MPPSPGARKDTYIHTHTHTHTHMLQYQLPLAARPRVRSKRLPTLGRALHVRRQERQPQAAGRQEAARCTRAKGPSLGERGDVCGRLCPTGMWASFLRPRALTSLCWAFAPSLCLPSSSSGPAVCARQRARIRLRSYSE